MKLIEQVFIQPDRFSVGLKADGSPEFVDVTPDWIRDYVAGTRGLLQAGYAPDVFLAHKPVGTPEGAPRKRDDDEASRLRGAAGWLEDIRQNDKGEGVYVLGITDSDVARKLEEGSIRFTSPEFRSAWLDGDGRVHRNVISHIALTHKPRNIRQSALVTSVQPGGQQQFACQFSLEDRMADDDEKDEKDAEGGGDPSGEPQKGDPVNGGEPASVGEAEAPVREEREPDMPEDSSGDEKQAERVKAIVAHLEELGISLPEDTFEQEMPTILDRILTGLKTAAAVKKQSEAEESVEEEEADDEPPVIEQQGMLQYSIGDLGGVENKLLARVIREEHGKLIKRLDGLLESGRSTPAFDAVIRGKLEAVQFSAEANLLPSLTVADLLEACEQFPPLSFAADEQVAQYGMPDHPDSQHYDDPSGTSPMSKDRAEALVDEQAKAGIKGIVAKK